MSSDAVFTAAQADFQAAYDQNKYWKCQSILDNLPHALQKCIILRDTFSIIRPDQNNLSMHQILFKIAGENVRNQDSSLLLFKFVSRSDILPMVEVSEIFLEHLLEKKDNSFSACQAAHLVRFLGAARQLNREHAIAGLQIYLDRGEDPSNPIGLIPLGSFLGHCSRPEWMPASAGETSCTIILIIYKIAPTAYRIWRYSRRSGCSSSS